MGHQLGGVRGCFHASRPRGRDAGRPEKQERSVATTPTKALLWLPTAGKLLPLNLVVSHNKYIDAKMSSVLLGLEMGNVARA